MIELQNITKTFGGFKALDGLTMTVPKGSVYGLVGPNGAGKVQPSAVWWAFTAPTAVKSRWTAAWFMKTLH